MSGLAMHGLVVTVAGQPVAIERNTPIRTVIEQNREAGVEPLERVDLPLGLLGVILGVAIAAGASAWYINARSHRRPPAEDRAFASLARGHGLGGAGAALARELARDVGLPPVALLASPGLLGAAISRADRSSWSSRPGWAQLVRAAGPESG